MHKRGQEKFENKLLKFILKSRRFMQILSASVACWRLSLFNCEDDILKKSDNRIIKTTKVMVIIK